MDSFKLYSYFKDRLQVKKSTNGWYLTECPECKDLGKNRVMRMHFGKGWVNCMRSSCELGKGSRLIDMVMLIEGMTYREAKVFVDSYDEGTISFTDDNISHLGGLIKNIIIDLPYGYKTILEGEGIIANRARTYLEGRGFNLEVLDRMGVGYCDLEHEDYKKNYFGYIILPYKKDNKLRYYNGRDFLGSALRYKNPGAEELGVGKSDLMFNEDCTDFRDEVYIMEGAIDAMSMDDNAVAIGGLSLSPVQKSKLINSRCKTFIVCLDNEFYKDSLRLASQLIEHKTVYAIKLEGGDPNKVGSKVVYELRKTLSPLTFVDIVKGLSL